MRSAGLGSMLLVAAVVSGLLSACGSTSARRDAEGGASGSATSGAAAGGAAKAGASSGGITASAGAAGKAESAGAGSPPLVLTEADADEPCETDPSAARWVETSLGLSTGNGQTVKLGAGGPLAVVVAVGADGLVARTSRAEAPWTEQQPLPDSALGDYPERIEVSSDGSTAVVLWRRAQRIFFSLLEADDSFAAAVELEVPQNVDVLALSGRRLLFGYGSAQGMQLVEYTPARGLVPITPIPKNYSRMSRADGDAVSVFSASGVLTEPDVAYPYAFGDGFAAAEPLSARPSAFLVSQTFFFSYPNGRGARVTRAWQDEATRGLHVTTKQEGAWGSEELVGRFEGSITTTPAIGYTQDLLLLAWEDEDQNVTVVREHAGVGWQPEQTLPRSRALRQVALVGAADSALVLGEQVLPDENVAVKKLYRRGSEGTWYCPKLVSKGFGNELVSDGEGFWFGHRVDAELRLWHFRP